MITTQKTLERFCAWCNRHLDSSNKAVGEIIPKELQNGTHGICVDCMREVMSGKE